MAVKSPDPKPVPFGYKVLCACLIGFAALFGASVLLYLALFMSAVVRQYFRGGATPEAFSPLPFLARRDAAP